LAPTKHTDFACRGVMPLPGKIIRDCHPRGMIDVNSKVYLPPMAESRVSGGITQCRPEHTLHSTRSTGGSYAALTRAPIPPKHPPRAPSVFGRHLQCQPVRCSGHPRGMPLVTRMLASTEQAWKPMAFFKCKFRLNPPEHRTKLHP
jgi:hypothetical protein